MAGERVDHSQKVMGEQHPAQGCMWEHPAQGCMWGTWVQVWRFSLLSGKCWVLEQPAQQKRLGAQCCSYERRGSDRAGEELGLWGEGSRAGMLARPLQPWVCSCSPSLGFLFCRLDLVPVPPLRVPMRTEQDRRPDKQSLQCLAQHQS